MPIKHIDRVRLRCANESEDNEDGRDSDGSEDVRLLAEVLIQVAEYNPPTAATI